LGNAPRFTRPRRAAVRGDEAAEFDGGGVMGDPRDITGAGWGVWPCVVVTRRNPKGKR